MTPQEMKVYRDKGYTLQQIGNLASLSRERVRQLLNKTYGRAKPENMIGITQMQKTLGVNYDTLAGYLKSRGIKPRQYYPVEILAACKKVCAHCGKEMSIGRVKYCLECGKEYVRYNYPFLSEEQRRKHVDCCLDWMRRNPERTKIIQRKAGKAYREREREKIVYLVTAKNHPMCGQYFRSLKNIYGGWLTLPNGELIRGSKVRRIGRIIKGGLNGRD